MTPFDFSKLCEAYRIATAPRGHKHQRKGWVNVECPFCQGDPGYHFGYNIAKGYFVCYRCGWHPIEKALLGIIPSLEKSKIKGLILDSRGDLLESLSLPYSEIVRPDEVKFPSGTGPMTDRHKKYISSRNFDPDKLERIWGLLGTGHTGDYKFRVIAPIYFNGQLVSYQGRDITEKQQAKYKGCREEKEVISHKHIFYGWDQVPSNTRTCIVVEGITGVWRLGPGALASFGVEYTLSQIRLLAQRFDRIWTLFDPDEAGDRAERFCNDLIVRGGEAEQLEISDKFDSGNMPQEMANRLMKETLK